MQGFRVVNLEKWRNGVKKWKKWGQPPFPRVEKWGQPPFPREMGSATISTRNGVSHHFHEPPYRGGRLNVSFAKPWNWLGEIGEKHAGSAVYQLEKFTNRQMWCLLKKVRTHFEQNPEP